MRKNLSMYRQIYKKILISLIKDWKKNIILLIILILASFTFSNKSYIEFSPKEFEVQKREITLSGTILNTSLPEEITKTEIILKKDTEKYKCVIVKFSKVIDLTSFWYVFVSNQSDEVVSSISSLPTVYGEYIGKHEEKPFFSWYEGFNKRYFLVIGTKRKTVSRLERKLKSFK